jgi:peptide deformylase
VAARPVVQFPDRILKQVARPLRPDERELARALAADLLDTMDAGPKTVGIAAPQIGELVRMVAVDCSTHPKALEANHGRFVLVNPEIRRAEGSEVAREGCLSIPELTANVRRATLVEVVALSPDGAPVALTATGFEARAIQHELDHLDGYLFLDRVDSLKRDVFRRRR